MSLQAIDFLLQSLATLDDDISRINEPFQALARLGRCVHEAAMILESTVRVKTPPPPAEDDIIRLRATIDGEVREAVDQYINMCQLVQDAGTPDESLQQRIDRQLMTLQATFPSIFRATRQGRRGLREGDLLGGAPTIPLPDISLGDEQNLHGERPTGVSNTSTFRFAKLRGTRPVVLKVLTLHDDAALSALQNEADVLYGIRDPGVVGCYGYSPELRAAVLERCDYALENVLHQPFETTSLGLSLRRLQTSAKSRLELVHQLAQTYVYLHRCGYTQRGIAIRRVLLMNDGSTRVTGSGLETMDLPPAAAALAELQAVVQFAALMKEIVTMQRPNTQDHQRVRRPIDHTDHSLSQKTLTTFHALVERCSLATSTNGPRFSGVSAALNQLLTAQTTEATATRERVSAFQCVHTCAEHLKPVRSVIELADRKLASASFDGLVIKWDQAQDGTSLTKLRGNAGEVFAVRQLHSGHLIAATEHGKILCWDLSSNQQLQTLEGHEGLVHALCQLADGRLVSASEDCSIKLWNVASGRCLHTYPNAHRKGLLDVIQLFDGRVVTSSRDGQIKVWDQNIKNTTLILHESNGESGQWAGPLTQLMDGRLASGHFDRTIRLWDLGSTTSALTIRGHEAPVYALVQLTDGQLASGSGDCTIKLWDVVSGACLRTFKDHIAEVYTLIQLTDGRLVSGSVDKTLKVWGYVPVLPTEK